MKIVRAVLTLSVALALAACAGAPEATLGAPSSASATPEEDLAPSAGAGRTAPGADLGDVVSDPLLDALGVDGLTGRQIVDHLEAVPLAERRVDVMASVRPRELVVSDTEREVAVPLPEDLFYVSLAPFRSVTHECFYHSLTTCRGELAGETLEVRITTTAGEVLLEGEVRTADNGFVGFWLPRGARGAIELGHEGRSATYEFTTDDDAPTCVTTVQLV